MHIQFCTYVQLDGVVLNNWIWLIKMKSFLDLNHSKNYLFIYDVQFILNSTAMPRFSLPTMDIFKW